MKNLIVYFSHTHNNEMLAKHLQKKLSCDLLKIEESRRRTGLTIFLDLVFNRTPKLKDHKIPLEFYTEFIFIAPIWGSKIASPIKSFLLKEKDRIKSYSFISLCGGAKGQAEKIASELKAIMNRDPKVVKELWVNDLLPPEKMNTIKYTSGYRATPADLEKFNGEIDAFLDRLIVKSEFAHR